MIADIEPDAWWIWGNPQTLLTVECEYTIQICVHNNGNVKNEGEEECDHKKKKCRCHCKIRHKNKDCDSICDDEDRIKFNHHNMTVKPHKIFMSPQEFYDWNNILTPSSVHSNLENIYYPLIKNNIWYVPLLYHHKIYHMFVASAPNVILSMPQCENEIVIKIKDLLNKTFNDIVNDDPDDVKFWTNHKNITRIYHWEYNSGTSDGVVIGPFEFDRCIEFEILKENGNTKGNPIMIISDGTTKFDGPNKITLGTTITNFEVKANVLTHLKICPKCVDTNETHRCIRNSCGTCGPESLCPWFNQTLNKTCRFCDVEKLVKLVSCPEIIPLNETHLLIKAGGSILNPTDQIIITTTSGDCDIFSNPPYSVSTTNMYEGYNIDPYKIVYKTWITTWDELFQCMNFSNIGLQTIITAYSGDIMIYSKQCLLGYNITGCGHKVIHMHTRELVLHGSLNTSCIDTQNPDVSNVEIIWRSEINTLFGKQTKLVFEQINHISDANLYYVSSTDCYAIGDGRCYQYHKFWMDGSFGKNVVIFSVYVNMAENPEDEPIWVKRLTGIKELFIIYDDCTEKKKQFLKKSELKVELYLNNELKIKTDQFYECERVYLLVQPKVLFYIYFVGSTNM